MKTVLASLLEECEKLSWCAILAPALLLCRAANIFAYVSLLIGSEDVGNLARVENVVDVFEETFLLDLRVSEEESCLSSLCASLAHKRFHVFAPLLSPVVLFDFY